MEFSQPILDYMREHKYTKEKFIDQIQMMNRVHMECGERITLKKLKAGSIKPTPENLYSLTDEQLVKIHKIFWDAL